MNIIERISVILILFVVTEVISVEINCYYRVNTITQDRFEGYDIDSITMVDFRGCEVRNVSSTAFTGMKNLITLTLTYNNIENLPEDVFDGLYKVDFIELGLNKLMYISKNLFSNLGELVHLDLAHNLIPSIEEGTFDTNTNLRTLLLKGNKLTIISTGLFRKLNKLEKLDISHNHIYKIEESALPNSGSLKSLIIFSNKLRYIDESVLETLTHATIDKNPWFCDCKLKPVYDKWKSTFTAHGWSPACNGPNKLRNIKWTQLSSDDFICEKINVSLDPDVNEILTEIGHHVSFNCYVTGDAIVSEVTWTNENNKKVVDVLHDAARTYSVQVSPNTKNALTTGIWYNLTINDARSSDDGLYKCVVNHENRIYEAEQRVIITKALNFNISPIDVRTSGRGE